MSLGHYFAMGGWTMYPLVLLLMLSLPASVGLPIAGYALGKPKLAFLFAMLLALLGLGAAGAGAFGRWLGLRMVNEAIVHVNPADQSLLLVVGGAEARVPLAFGLAVAALPLAAACVSLGRAFSDKVSKAGAAGGLVMGLGTALLFGALSARQFNLVSLETAMGSASPEQQSALLATGADLATTSWAVALVGGLPLVLIGVALLRAAARSGRASTTAGAEAR